MLAKIAAPHTTTTTTVTVLKPATVKEAQASPASKPKLIHYNRLIEKEEYLIRLMDTKHRRTTALAKEGKYKEALELDKKLYEEAVKIQRTLNVMWAKYALQPHSRAR
jgi:hypothetical protein